MQVWRHGRLPPVQITTRDLGVDTQWSAWRNPVQQKRISFFHVYDSNACVRASSAQARIVKSLFSVGLCGVEVGGMSDQHVKDLLASARSALAEICCSGVTLAT
eukprot:430502-Amphidinium_carterae.2